VIARQAKQIETNNRKRLANRFRVQISRACLIMTIASATMNRGVHERRGHNARKASISRDVDRADFAFTGTPVVIDSTRPEDIQLGQISDYLSHGRIGRPSMSTPTSETFSSAGK
jgi:hypothetical protein